MATGSEVRPLLAGAADVGIDARWPTVCTRCAEALTAIGFAPETLEVA